MGASGNLAPFLFKICPQVGILFSQTLTLLIQSGNFYPFYPHFYTPSGNIYPSGKIFTLLPHFHTPSGKILPIYARIYIVSGNVAEGRWGDDPPEVLKRY